MKSVILIAAMMFAPLAYGELRMREGDNYIDSDEGRIVLFALPGCEVYGNPGLYGFAEWNTGKAEIICWKYDRVIYIYTTNVNRTIIFDPSDVRTKGATLDDTGLQIIADRDGEIASQLLLVASIRHSR